ncbi:MAG: DUF2155 domain-containing protein [Alphaproteobacteria bacterium]|jgi:hypothetical protein
MTTKNRAGVALLFSTLFYRSIVKTCAGLALAVTLGGATFVDQKSVVLHALDKIAAKVSVLTAPVGESVRFGRLKIDVKACRMRPPEEPPESAAFLEITDLGRNLQPVEAFRGWMFASSPSLSAMDHPLYDIWVARCE